MPSQEMYCFHTDTVMILLHYPLQTLCRANVARKHLNVDFMSLPRTSIVSQVAIAILVLRVVVSAVFTVHLLC